MEADTDWSKVPEALTESEQGARYAHDNKLYVTFYLRPVLQQTESENANRPIYRDVPHVRIMVPGDRLSIVDRLASQDDKNRFAQHWAKFEAGGAQEVVGTRLEAIPWMTRSKVEEYKFFGIITVEQLAAASDQVGQKFPGFQQDKQKATKWLDATTGTDARVKALEDQLAAMKAQLEEKAEA
jgi:hypothetical protein